MVDPTEELTARAEILHKRVAAGDPAARARPRALVELKTADDELLAVAAADVRRKHCLAVVAREAGFTSWDHALRVLRGNDSEHDFGTLLDEDATSATLNAWYADYDEARRTCRRDARAVRRSIFSHTGASSSSRRTASSSASGSMQRIRTGQRYGSIGRVRRTSRRARGCTRSGSRRLYAVSFTAGGPHDAGAPEDVRAPRTIRDLLAELARGEEISAEIAASLQEAALDEARSDAYAAALREAAAV